MVAAGTMCPLSCHRVPRGAYCVPPLPPPQGAHCVLPLPPPQALHSCRGNVSVLRRHRWQQQDAPRRNAVCVRAVAEATEQHVAPKKGLKVAWYALVANAEFMLHDVQNEAFAEQLRERRRFFAEKNRELDFFLVSEPTWLDQKFPDQAAKVRRPSVALVSTDKIWITFMKLRLDRVLKLELGELTPEEVLVSGGPVPDFPPLDMSKWTAPYAPYKPGWWNMFMITADQL